MIASVWECETHNVSLVHIIASVVSHMRIELLSSFPRQWLNLAATCNSIEEHRECKPMEISDETDPEVLAAQPTDIDLLIFKRENG
jgi:hypothetical protein